MFGHKQLLDFPDFSAVVQKVLYVQAQETKWLAIGQSEQVNDVVVLKVLVENTPLRCLIQNPVFEQVDEIVNDGKVVGSPQADSDRCQMDRV